jgi:peptide/nickel transport system permease protein
VTAVTNAAKSESGPARAASSLPAIRFIGGRLLGAVGTVVALSSCVFFVLRLVPGDPAALVLGDEASPVARQLLRAKLGLDLPLSLQYVRFIRGLLSWDLGTSLMYPGEATTRVVASAIRPTAELAIVAVVIGACLGILAAELSVGPFFPRAKSWIYGGVLLVAAVPLLSFAPVVTWALAVEARLVPLPGDPEAKISGLLFAAGLLGLPLGAQVARVARASLLDQASAKFLDVATAKGAGPIRVWFLHALAVAAPPIAVVVAMQLGALLSGAVVLERLFDRPGLGTLMLKAYSARDLPVLEACVFVAGVLFVVTQTVAAAIQAAVDPRRGEGSARD